MAAATMTTTQSRATTTATATPTSGSEKKGRGILLLWLLLTYGLGALSGFLLFHVCYSKECKALLDESLSQSRSNLEFELRQLESRFSQEKSELNSQNVEAAAATVSRDERIVSLEQEIEELRQGGQVCESNPSSMTSNAVSQHLVLLESLLEEKIREVEELELQLNSRPSGNSVDSQLFLELKLALQQQYFAQTILKYGTTEGSFHIDFFVTQDDVPLDYFTVEIYLTDRNQMTFMTFFKLVEAGLYDGTTIQPTNLQYKKKYFILMGGNPKHAKSKRIQANLARRFAESGFNAAEPFFWDEITQIKDCQDLPGSFWFPSRGPHFHIALLPSDDPIDDANSQRNQDCQSRVIAGMDILQNIFIQPNDEESEIPSLVIDKIQIRRQE